ncbi:MAG: CoA ester lyase [Alphaproteobacteria bacterium]|nr:CoA ester lyase [Alphaproteobacteria bacterium]
MSQPPRRSMLFVPALRPDRFSKAIATGADIVIVDWEDAVVPDRKAEARELTGTFFGDPTDRPVLRYLRINSPRLPDGLRDLEALFEMEHLPDGIMIPKVESPEEVRWMTEILQPYRQDIELFPTVETAKGVRAVAEVALASDATTILGFGAVDLVAETGSDLSWDSLLYTRSQVVLAATEARIEALDTVWIEIDDQAGLEDESRRARAIGFSGKAAIHPSQVAPINAAFSPSNAEVNLARRIVEAAEGDFSGALQIDGKMIDEPVIIAARRTMARAERISAAAGT